MLSGLLSKADMPARFIPKQTVSNRMYEYYDLSSSQRRSGQLATGHVERCDAGRVVSFHRYTRPKEWRSSSQRGAITRPQCRCFRTSRANTSNGHDTKSLSAASLASRPRRITIDGSCWSSESSLLKFSRDRKKRSQPNPRFDLQRLPARKRSRVLFGQNPPAGAQGAQASRADNELSGRSSDLLGARDPEGRFDIGRPPLAGEARQWFVRRVWRRERAA
jgi:hypothetical protein